MNIKRALWISILLYIASFAVGIITGLLLGIDFENATEAPVSVWYIGIASGAILMALFTLWYFRSPTTTANLKNGFYFGLFVVLIAFMLEGIVIIPYILTTDSPADITAYYTNPFLWISIVINIVTAAAVGKLKEA